MPQKARLTPRLLYDVALVIYSVRTEYSTCKQISHMNIKKEKLIVFEGGDGAGKGACLTYVREQLGEDAFVYTREPGGSDIGNEIRALLLEKEMSPETELLLFFADRVEHMKRVIEPALSQGKHVLSDRFALSTYAYQVAGREHPELEALYRELYARTVSLYIEPYYIYLDIDPAIALERVVGERGTTKTRFDTETVAFHTRVRAAYHKELSAMPKERYAIIDASQPFSVVRDSVFQTVRYMCNI